MIAGVPSTKSAARNGKTTTTTTTTATTLMTNVRAQTRSAMAALSDLARLAAVSCDVDGADGTNRAAAAGGAAECPVEERLALAGSALRGLAHSCGVTNSQRDCAEWLWSLMDEDGMCDTFATFAPPPSTASPRGISTATSATITAASASLLHHRRRPRAPRAAGCRSSTTEYGREQCAQRRPAGGGCRPSTVYSRGFKMPPWPRTIPVPAGTPFRILYRRLRPPITSRSRCSSMPRRARPPKGRGDGAVRPVRHSRPQPKPAPSVRRPRSSRSSCPSPSGPQRASAAEHCHGWSWIRRPKPEAIMNLSSHVSTTSLGW